MTSRLGALAAVVLGVFALSGCSKDETTNPGVGTVRAHLTDAPAAYDQVNIVVTQVSVHRGAAVAESDTMNGGWEVISTATQTFNLLTLQNGVMANLAQAQVPAGHYSQVRLRIGTGSNVVVDGVTHPLEVPSGAQTGLKLVGPFDLPDAGVIDLTLDFDANRSIVLTGSGTYMLKPVIRVIVGTPTTTTGAIRGHLLPEGVDAQVFAIMAADTITSTSAAQDGRFTLALLPAGTYGVAVHPAATYRDTALANISVTKGQTTDVGDIQLTAKAP